MITNDDAPCPGACDCTARRAQNIPAKMKPPAYSGAHAGVHGDTASNAYEERREPEMGDYQETEIRIGGKRANIRTYSQIENGQRTYRAELNIGDWANAEIELYMEGLSRKFDECAALRVEQRAA